MHKLNEQQRQAVLHKTGPMLVTAGPGSGKTHVIISRLLNMIYVEKIPAEKIAVITFTKEAAKSMCSRFQKSFQQNEGVCFATFHSFYYQILRSSSNYSGYRLIQDNEKKYILSRFIDLEDNTEKEQFIESLINAISYYKNTLDMSQALKNIEIDEEKLLKYFHKYEHEKNRRKCMDYDDMLYLCMQLLEKDPVLKQKWQMRFDYYLVDEFQDCNIVQYQILRMLAVHNNIFVVGDDDQSIYGFRGAKAQLMDQFLKDYPESEMVQLTMNYRCSEPIVKASMTVIDDNKHRIRKQLRALQTEENNAYVKVMSWPEKKMMHQYFRDLFDGISKEALQHHALLFRTNQEMQIFAVDFMKANIPFRMKNANTSIYEHFIVQDMEAFMEIAEGNCKRNLFLRIMNKPKREIGREAFTSDLVDLNDVAAFYKDPYIENVTAYEAVEKFKRQLLQLKTLSMPLRIKFIRNAMGYDKYLVKRAGGKGIFLNAWFELLDWLQDEVRELKNMEEWKEKKKTWEYMNDKKEERGIYMMTMHASKGLEFEHCYIINVNDGNIPKYQKGEILSEDKIEEERRIFYVGMTRAKKTLELHFLQGTKERPKFPSRFIKKLMK